MTAASPALRVVARLAVLTGYCAAKLRAWARPSQRSLVVTLRTVQAEGVRLRVPPHWGEPERDALGRFVLHNRPKRDRIDGDAVWYSTAVELRILPGRQAEARNAEAMTTRRRYLETPTGWVTVELAVANGVGSRRRKAADRVLDTATPVAQPPVRAC